MPSVKSAMPDVLEVAEKSTYFLCCFKGFSSSHSMVASEYPFSAKKQIFGSELLHFVRFFVGFCLVMFE